MLTAALLAAVAPGGVPPEVPLEGPAGYGLLLVRVVLALGGVCLLAYLALRFLGRRLPGATASGPLRLVARCPLEPRRTLYVVEAGGRYFLVGTGESGPPATLAELDGEAVRAGESVPPRSTFLELLLRRPRSREEESAAAAETPEQAVGPARRSGP